MTAKLWLIANMASQSTNPQAIEGIKKSLTKHGFGLTRTIDLSEEGLPSTDDLAASSPDIVACFGGDGTATAVVDAYRDQHFPLLVLPGGTMNLLARKLHGEATPEEIIARAAIATPKILTLPQIESSHFHSLVGVIAGPTTIWGDVREALRSGNIMTLLRSIPRAFAVMKHGRRVKVGGVDGAFPALYVEAQADTLLLYAIDTRSASALLRHGVAWMTRDFLGGPKQLLRQATELRLSTRGGSIRLLVDGERQRVPSKLSLTLGKCPARFIATTADDLHDAIKRD